MKISRISRHLVASLDAESAPVSPELQLLFGYRDVDTTSFRNLTQHVLYGTRANQFQKSELEVQLESGPSIITRYPDGLRFRDPDVQDDWDGVLREIDLATYKLVFDQNFGQESISGPELCFQLKRRFGVPFGDSGRTEIRESLDELKSQLRAIQNRRHSFEKKRKELFALHKKYETTDLPVDFLAKQRSSLENRVENQRVELDRLRAQAYELENEIELAVQNAVPTSEEPWQHEVRIQYQSASDPQERNQELGRITEQIEKWKLVQQDVYARLTDLKSEIGSPNVGEFDATFEESRTLIGESESKLLDLLDTTDAESPTHHVIKDLISLNHGICDSLSQVQDLWRDKIVDSEIKDLDRCFDSLESYVKRLTDRRIQLTGAPQASLRQNCRCRTHREPAKVDRRYIERLKVEHDRLLNEIESADHRLNASVAEWNALPRETYSSVDLGEIQTKIDLVDSELRQCEAEAERINRKIKIAGQPISSGSHLLSLISSYAEQLTNGKVTRVFIADNGSDLVVVNSQDGKRGLSGAEFVCRTQIRLAISLGCAELLAESGYSVPLILEDVFVAMDERDLDLAIRCLIRFSKTRGQIILLTNNRFVRDFVSGKGLPTLDLPDRYSGDTLPPVPRETDRHQTFHSRINWNEVNRHLDVAAMDQYGADKRHTNTDSAEISFSTDSYQSTRDSRSDSDIRGSSDRSRQSRISKVTRSQRYSQSNQREGSTRRESRTSSRSTGEQSLSVRNARESNARESNAQTRSTQDSRTRTTQQETSYKFYLNLSSDVEAAPTIGPKTAERLEKVGIVTVSDLLDSDPEWVATELKHRRIKPADVALWQQQARLVCQVPNLRGHDAQILVACGILNSEQLATMNAHALFEIVEPFVSSKEGQKLIRGATEPDLAEVQDWVQWARHQRPLDRAA